MESFEIVLWNSELDMRSLRKVVRVKSTPGTAKNACFSLSTDKSQVNPVTLTVLWYISANRQSCVFLILYSVEILVIETFPSLTFLSHWEKKYLYVYVNLTLIIYWIQDHIDKIKYWYSKKMILHFYCHFTVLPLRSHFKIWQKVE